MLRTQTEDLKGMRHVGVAGHPGNPVGPLLNLRATHLHTATARPAHHMMVMISAFGDLGRPAQPVLRLTVARVHDIGSSEFGEQIQPPIHRGQADPLTPAPQLGIHILGRTKPVRFNQHRVDSIGLPRVTQPPSPRAPRYGISSSQRHSRFPSFQQSRYARR